MDMGILIDLVILILLGATIFYAAKLSVYLKTFHDGRKDMNFLLQDLSSSVSRAENAIQGMQISAGKSGQKLQDIINEAKFLSDELRFMNDAGDSLANRLEKLAERNRELVDLLEQAGGVGHITAEKQPEQQVAVNSQNQRAERPAVPVREPAKEQSFSIQDREFDDYEEFGDFEEYDDSDDALLMLEEVMTAETESTADVQLKSQAERDLYEALRRRSARKQRTDKVS